MKSPLLTAIGLTLACLSGWAHGLLTDRWGIPVELAAVASQVENLSLEFDGWTSEVSRTLNDHTRKASGAEGYFSRSYTHEQTGDQVHVTILCGRSGPISLHTPDVCFVGGGVTQLGEETRTTLSREGGEADVPAHFWMADFRPPPSRPGPDSRTYWAWSSDGQSWETPENPRLKYSRKPYLYRLYFTVPVDQYRRTEDGQEAHGPAADFMPEFLNRFAELTRSTEI